MNDEPRFQMKKIKEVYPCDVKLLKIPEKGGVKNVQKGKGKRKEKVGF